MVISYSHTKKEWCTSSTRFSLYFHERRLSIGVSHSHHKIIAQDGRARAYISVEQISSRINKTTNCDFMATISSQPKLRIYVIVRHVEVSSARLICVVEEQAPCHKPCFRRGVQVRAWSCEDAEGRLRALWQHVKVVAEWNLRIRCRSILWLTDHGRQPPGKIVHAHF